MKYVGIEIASSSLWDRLSVGSRLAWALRGIGILGIILLVTVYAPLLGTAGTVSDTWQTPYFGLHIVRFEIVLGYVLTGTALALGGSHLRHRSPIVLAALTLAVVPGYLLLVVQEATVLSALWHSLTALPIVALPVLGAIDREGTTRGRTLTTAVFVVFVLVGTLIVVRIPYVEYIPRDDPSWVLLPLGYLHTARESRPSRE